MTEVRIHEVGLRDGLQIEKQTVPRERKIQWVQEMDQAGLDVIQIGSFVNPEKVPSMADTDDLFRHFSQAENRVGKAVLSGLVLNDRGLDRGMECGVQMFCLGLSASETHSRKNTGKGTEEAAEQILGMAKKALAAGKIVQASVQSAFGCGFEGPIPADRVLSLVQRYLEVGVRTISLADTAGHANPMQVADLFSRIRKLDPTVEMACHFHDTYGLGLANCWAAYQSGVKYFESAFGGLGGCPFTKVAAGNVCTEDLVHSLQRMGIRTDLDLDRLIALAKDVSAFFDRKLPGAVLQAGSLVRR